MKGAKAAENVANGIGETLSYYPPAPENWRLPAHQQPAGTADARDPTTNAGSRRIPDGNSVLMLVAARLRHVASTRCCLCDVPSAYPSPQRRAEKIGNEKRRRI